MNIKVKYRWFILFIGVLAQSTFAIGFAGIPVSGIIMRDAYSFSLFELGIVLGAMGLGVAISEILWGILTDVLGDKVVLILGLVLSSSVFLVIALYFTPEKSLNIHYLNLSFMLLLAGAFGGSINSASGRTVMSWFTDDERGFAMSIRQTAIPVGGAIGTALLPYLAFQYGFMTVFLTLGVLGLCVAVIVLLFIKSKSIPAIRENSGQYATSPLKSIDVWRVTLSAAFLTVPQMAVLTFGGVYLKDNLNVDLLLISTILIGVQIGGGALRIWSGHYTDKHKNRVVTLKKITLLCSLSSIVLCVLVDLPLFGIIFLILTGLLGHAWHGIAYTECAVKAGVQRAGTALGMIGTTVFISSFLTPVIVSNTLNMTGWNVVWFVVGLLTIMAHPFLISEANEKSEKRLAIE